MIPGKTQTRLTIFLVGMTFLNGFSVWRLSRGVALGLPDFSTFYTAARIVHEGNASRLYDKNLQAQVQRSFAPFAVAKRGAILPYNHPPFEALLFTFLGRFSYLTAYLLWLAVNLGLLLGLTATLRRHLTELGKAPNYLWWLACFGFYPIVVALLQGQDSILVLFSFCMAFLAIRQKADFRVGAWLGLGLCKFQLVLPFVLPLLLLRRVRLAYGFLATAFGLLTLGFLTAGWSGLLSYPRYLGETERYLWGGMPNLRGLLTSLLPAPHSPAVLGLLLLASVAVFAAMTYAWHQDHVVGGACLELAFALGILGTILLSYHLYLHDLSLSFLAVLLVLERMFSHQLSRPWIKAVLSCCLAVLFASPIYFLLLLRNRIQPLAAVLLVFFVTLMIEVVLSSKQPSVTAMSSPTQA